MAGTTLTTLALTKLLTPVINDLYKGAKDQVKDNLSKWSTGAGIRKIATTLIKIDKVKTIWSAEDEVSLQKFYYPSKIYCEDEEVTINTTTDLPAGNLVIEGIVGQGKSIFMRYLAASILNIEPPSVIPAFIELRTITSKRSISDTISIFLNSIGVKHTSDTFDYLASSGKLILILDGFDEIPSELVSDTILELEVLQTKHPELKIIVSSRPRSHIQNVVGFKVLELVPLSADDYDPFVSKLISSATKRFDVIEALRDCSDSIQGIIHTPLMLTLVVIIYQTEKEIPSTLSDFFDKLFGIVFTKHDRLKAGFNRQHHSGLSERRLKQLFEAFCFMTIQHGAGRSLSGASFDKAFDDAVKYIPECKCENDAFRKDIVKVACLMLEEGLDTTTFLHKSILDYHAAAFVRDLPDATASTFYATAIKKYRHWEHVLQFLKNIDQLRYAQHYTLKYLPDALKELSSLIEKENTGELITYLEQIQPQAKIGLVGNKVSEWGLLKSVSSELKYEISDLLSTVFFGLCEDAKIADITEAANLTGSDKPDKNGKVVLSIRAIITVFGPDRLWTGLRAIELSTAHVLKTTTAYIEEESKKENIFEDILANNSAATSPLRRSRQIRKI
jgi:hypothetical protein